jgi:hypothetical protein
MVKIAEIVAVENRAIELKQWIQKNAPEALTQQMHLDESTQERIYWHYGYMTALRDVLRLLTNSEAPSRKSYSVDNSNSYPLV